MLRVNKNILLKKDDVGMPKPSTRELPIFGHSYGLPGARDKEGVAKCKLYPIIINNLILLYSNYRVDSSLRF